MYENINFGFQSNLLKCSCGHHHGCGEFTPEQRAAMAARMRDKMPDLMTENQKEYLKDWEIYHGPVKYRMDVIGTNSGEFIKYNKGQKIMGPVYIDMNSLTWQAA